MKIGFIGAGNMTHCLINGLIKNHYSKDQLLSSDKNYSPQNNQEIISRSDIIILAVKPQSLKSLCRDIKNAIQLKRPLIISIASGITEKTLSSWLGENLPIVRCMPNVAASLGSSATGLFANKNVSAFQHDAAENILKSVGMTLWVEDEKLIDVIAALSGCGPAYFYFIMEALEEIAVQLGLTQESAHLLLSQTLLGTAQIALGSSEPIPALRQRVTSKGGMTEKAIEVLEKNNIKKIFSDTLIAAHTRAVELSTQFI